MRIGFYLERATFLKTMGCLIDACIARGDDVFLFYEKGGRQLGDKTYQLLKPQMLTPFSIPQDHIQGVDGFAQVDVLPPLDVMVTHEGFHTLQANLADIARLRAQGTKVISLVHFFEIAQRPLEALDHFDLTVYPSEFCRDLHFDLQSEPGQIEREKEQRSEQYVVAGAPMYDQIGKISRSEAGKELNIPSDKKVVLLIAPVISSNTPWRFHVWGKQGRLGQTRDAIRAGKLQYLWEIWFGSRFDDAVRAIRRLCDRNSAMLIVKSRGKQSNIPYLVEVADIYFDGREDDYYPVFTTYKLMAAADLCFTFNSMAAVEAVATGIPCINVYVPHIDLAGSWPESHTQYHHVLEDGRPNSLMNYSGCITKIDRKHLVHWLEEKGISHFFVDAERRKTYVRKFLGIEEKASSQRVLEALARFEKAESQLLAQKGNSA